MVSAIQINQCKVCLGKTGDHTIDFVLDTLSVENGAQVAVIGSSGSGKSTLLNVISGLQPIDSGEVYVLEKAIHSLSVSQADRFRGSHLGFVYQNFNLLNGFSALENILIGMRFGRMIKPSHQKNEACLLLQQVGLAQRIHSRVENLSVGERQRVAIARALANKPSLLLADEPTGSLDPTTAREVLNLILTISQERGVTLLFVTHDQKIAQSFPCMFHCLDVIKMDERQL